MTTLKISLLGLLLVCFIGKGKAQTKPVAVNDTVTTNNYVVQIHPTQNDLTFGQGIGIIDTLIHLGNFTLDSESSGLIQVFLQYHYGQMGLDSFLYVMHPFADTTDSYKDTAMIYVNVVYALSNQSTTFETPFYKAIVNTNGTLFENENTATAGFMIPKDSGTATIFASGIWVGGKIADSAQVSVLLYNQGYRRGLPGPATDSVYYTPAEQIKWNRFWYLTSWDIQQFKTHYNQPGYTIPEPILDWPAHGDTTKGQEYNLAPWVDVNHDGIYNPHDGDYPKIKGSQCLYFIYHAKSVLNQLPVNVQVMLYNVRCTNKCFQQSLLADITVSNASNQTIDSTYIGLWTDLEDGCYSDNYIGSDVMRDMYYVYNGDNFDEDANGIHGYGAYPAAEGITFLKGAKMDSDGADNAFGVGTNETVNGTGYGDGIPDNEYWGMQSFISYNSGSDPQGDPDVTNQFYNYLNNIWLDGTPMTYGGDGYGGSTNCRYMVPGSSDTAYWYGTDGVPQDSIWTEATAGDAPGFRRGVASTGPFTLKPGQKQTITVAYVYGRNLTVPGAQAGVSAMMQNVDSVRYYFNHNIKPCGGNFTGIAEVPKQQLKVVVYPNPFNQKINITTGKPAAYTVALFSVTGKLILKKSFTGQTFELNPGRLAKGMYILKVKGPNGQKMFKMLR